MRIHSISGSVIKAIGTATVAEMVYVGSQRLIGEVISLGTHVVIQVFEDTTGLKVGDEVMGTGQPLSMTLGPGLLGQVFDGIGRNLADHGTFIGRGKSVRTTQYPTWQVKMLVKAGETIAPHSLIAEVIETPLVNHYITAEVGGLVSFSAPDGAYTQLETLATIGGVDVTLMSYWPVKTPRPYQTRYRSSQPMLTGQRVIDTFFPIARGGTAAIPGGFGTGKTLTIHQIAKHAQADVLVYIGCGERGNEIRGILEDFTQLTDPQTGRPLMEKTVIIANTSNMPVSAREASIYTGITIAEYYRDMGYHVALMADSTSRFAEALRELSGRLMEMPAEEGYPSYLPTRLASFYERAGWVQTLNNSKGSVTIIGAVSPQGGDMSDIVTIYTKRYTRCFWVLNKELAYSRHYPAVDWLVSYSDYLEDLTPWYDKQVGRDFIRHRDKALSLLRVEEGILEIAKLIGEEVLHDNQKLILAICGVIRQGFLYQNALIPTDGYTPLAIQAKFLSLILELYERAEQLVGLGIPMEVLAQAQVWELVRTMREGEVQYVTDLAQVGREIQGFYVGVLQRYQVGA